MKRSPVTLLAASALLVGGAFASSPASAGGHRHSPNPDGSIDSARTIADGLFTPLSLAIDGRGHALVSQNFLGELLSFAPDGTRSTIATAPGEEIGAVSTKGGTTYWATTGQDPAAPSTKLFAQRAGGQPRQIADLRAFEEANNPDAATSYGFQGLPAACAAQFPADSPATSKGVVDSHPYASYASGNKVYVADAGANAILSVKSGRRAATPEMVAVLLPVSSVVSAEAAAAQGLPACVAGYTYNFDFVPTDVEKGRDGWLYVTALPGGPEDASLGARGAVYKVNPYTGAVRRVAGGFVGAVDLAVGPDGTIAVAELFGGEQGKGQVTLVNPRSSRRTILPFTAPGAVEWTGSSRRSKLYVTTDAFVPGEQGPQAIGKLQVLTMGKDRRGWHHHH